MAEKIGFVGLGIMGGGMAANLLKAGFDLTVWNRTAAKAEALVTAGAKAASTLQELGATCDIIVTCVSDTPDMEAVLFGDGGLAAAMKPGSLLIDCSTISPEASKEFATRLAEGSAGFLDSPISGGSEGATKGTLSIMVGGEEAHFQRAMPVYTAMGKNITHVGPVGAGQTVKLVNQILAANSMLALAEAYLFAEAGGVDLDKMLSAIEHGAAGSWTLSNRGPQVRNRDWCPGFMIDLMQKDLRIVLESADEKGVPLLSCSTIFHLYRTLQKRGLGKEGNHALIKALEEMSGITVGKDKE